MLGKARPVHLKTRTFSKVGDARAFFSTMLKRYKAGDRVNDEDGADLEALLERHDDYDEKAGAGVDHFIVAAAPQPHSGNCFWVRRKDATRMDFSYIHCLRNIE